MSHKSITHAEKETVYAEGKQAFDEYKRRGYNPYARSNLILAVNWWHGWDTAEEESNGERSPLDEHDSMTRPSSQP
jgi:hypothetical protein